MAIKASDDPDPMAENDLKDKSGDEAAHKDPKNTLSRVWRGVLELFSVALSGATLWLGILSLLMVREEINLSFFKPHAQQWFSQAFAGKTAQIENFSARWVQDRQTIELRADNIEISGYENAPGNIKYEKIKDVRSEFKLTADYALKPKLVALSVNGGAVTVARLENGRVQIGLGTPQSYESVGPLWHSDISKSTPAAQNKSPIEALKKIDIKSTQIFITDERQGLALALADVDGSYQFEDGFMYLEGVGEVRGEGNNAPFSLRLKTTTDGQTVSVFFKTNGLIPKQIAPERGALHLLGNLDAPIDLQTQIEMRPEIGLQDLKLRLDVGEGQLKTGTSYKPFSRALIRADYNGAKQNINVTTLEIESEALGIAAKGEISNLGEPGLDFLRGPIGFFLETDDLRLNAGQKFDTPFVVSSAQAQGYFDLGAQKLDLEKLELDFGSYQADLSIAASRDDLGKLEALDFGGDISGQVSARQLLDLWPNTFALGARNWVRDGVKTATLSNFKITAALDQDDLSTGRITNDHLNMSFDVQDADIRYMRLMPWMRDVSGKGVLQGNQLDFQILGGRVDGLMIESGAVAIPKLSPHGDDFTIDLNGAGTVDEMLRVSNFPPFEFSKKFGISPDDFDGTGQINLRVVRPLREFPEPGEIKYAVEGHFVDVGMPAGIGDNRLRDGVLALKADRTGITISGPVKIGNWQALLDWQKPLGAETVPAQYKVTGSLSRDDLDGFGIGLRRYLGGEIGLSLQGAGDGIAVKSAVIKADFKDTDINFGTIWQKAKGEPGSLNGNLFFEDNGAMRLEDITLKAAGLDLAGSVKFADDFKLETLDVPRFYIDRFIDASVQVKPMDAGLLDVAVTGRFFNIKTWVSRAFQTRSSAGSLPIHLRATLEKLALSEDYVLSDAAATFVHNGQAVRLARLTGTLPQGKFLAEIKEDEQTDRRQVLVEIPDAAEAAIVFLGLDNIAGGQLHIDGYLPPVGGEGGLVGNLILTDFTLKRAPAFAQILSLASLTGLANTLSGNGMSFAKLDLQFSLEKQTLKIRNARASGPALGLTGEGDVFLGPRSVDFNGVLVPAYTVNSVLGNIPVLGGLVVGKKGEGMFALNYAVKGPFSATQISVNPLSALTPGFLRRIFDVEREAVIAQDGQAEKE